MTGDAESRSRDGTRAAGTPQATRAITPAQPARRFDWEKVLRADEALHCTAKCVGMMLASYASQDGTSARPGAELLAKATSTSEPTVRRALKTLTAAGYIELTGGRLGRRRDHANEYRLTIPPDQQSSMTTDHPRSVITDDPDHRSPVTRLPITGDQVQAHDQPTTRAAAREKVDELPLDQVAAARQLVLRLAPAISEVDARDCIRQLAARRRPPDDYAAYTRGFDAAAVLENAERHRARAAAKDIPSARAAERASKLCPVPGHTGRRGVDEAGDFHCSQCVEQRAAEQQTASRTSREDQFEVVLS